MKKGSKAAKAWGAKMERLRGGGTKRKKSTRKGQRRKTARRAYEGIKRKAKSYKRRKTSSGMKMPTIPGWLKKVFLGVGAAGVATVAVGTVAPQYVPIVRPVAAAVAGGIPGFVAEIVLNSGLLDRFTGMISGGGINQTRLASGL
tara:strand:+ start:719 stop:1153 length:435 start_codon:yes stop_codon:yes gene_type:complete